MSVFNAMHQAILVVTTALGGVLCTAGFLLTFALARLLQPYPVRPVVGLGELAKPMLGGMLLSVAILCVRLDGDPAMPAFGVTAPDLLVSVLGSVGLAGVCAGGWTARPRAGGTPVGTSDLVRRLCVAGDTHEDATARVAVRLALAAGYDPARASDLMAAASLHDIGKTGLPDAVLRKAAANAASLDPVEQRVLQSHTRVGFRMLAHSHEPMLDLAADIALHHHEHWDGSGYPGGLAGEQIPLTSRVVALAESFDAILGAPTEVASLVHAIESRAGTQFDPQLVSILLADLPGMINARGAKSPARARDAEPAAAWRQPNAFRPQQVKPIAV